MTNQEKLQALRKRIDDTKIEMQTVAKNLFRDISKELFQQYSTLAKFAWAQYTPYFNDGDECIFHTHGLGIWFTDDKESDDNFYEHEFSTWSLKEKPPDQWTVNEKAGMAVTEFFKNFRDEDLKEMFGDHIKVFVTKDGIEIEEYSHD